MKLISLNIWGGRVWEPLLKFIKEYQDIDIFCFQEIYHNAPDQMTDNERQPDLNIFTELKKILPNHIAYFRPVIKDIYGIAIFAKKEMEVLEEGEAMIHRNSDYLGRGGNHSRNLEWIKFNQNNKTSTVINVHGLWNGKGKSDTPERLAQSQKIKEFLDKTASPKILCGDFNLLPDTESIKMLEDGMVNLIKKHGVTSTRTGFYEKPEKFADFILVSTDVKILDFKVLPDEVSDHTALFLEFRVGS